MENTVTLAGDFWSFTDPSERPGMPLHVHGETESVHVAVNEDSDRPRFSCVACGAETTDDPDRDEICPDRDYRTWDEETDDWVDDPDDPSGPHAWEPVPASWLNSAGISFRAEDDSVTVSISVGDPRGAFTMTVRRVPDDVDGDLAGKLIMHVPYPGETTPHVPMRRLHDGTYIIGESDFVPPPSL